jgi:predicted neuraminidase
MDIFCETNIEGIFKCHFSSISISGENILNYFLLNSHPISAKSMKNLSGIILLFTLVMNSFTLRAQENFLPDPAVPGENGYVSGELIFPLDHKPTPQCHASTIEETPSGMLAAWFAGKHEKNKDVGIWISHLVEGKWETPLEVVNGVQNSYTRYPCWNPVLFQPDKGPLMLFYKVGPSPREWWGEMMSSEDGGHTWSSSRRLGSSRLGYLMGPVKNKPIQLEDGTILCPSSTETIDQGQLLWRVHLEITKDYGLSWEVIGPVNDGIEFDAIQPSILTYPDGKMQILCRTMQDVISESWSEDGGKNWSKMAATSLPNPSAGTDALTLRDGRQLLVYNHSKRGKKSPGRKILNVAISADGKIWEPVLTLENKKGEYSYPAVIQASDGLVHITYTYNRETVKHVIIDPRELPKLN